ncbi:alpha/beta fold hydrolase [Solicola gregarius]|uniref:Alpha/beta hydrolase n=1 Tax=Solicola gregarius TaxID=2908642 RepID=A0AA46TFD3_9ACTN|nr:alpha/beta hydrolase [Solicola gregarius]UYM04306.1 alpha/beta hydrolase [Solicola gregarius]
MTTSTATGIAYDRAGPRGSTPLVLIHAGIADRRMWDPQWAGLTADRDVLRLDLRGYGESVARPTSDLDPVGDVLETLAEAEIDVCDIVAASFGAGVAVEVALTRPALVRSLLLSAPGGSLIPDVTPDLQEFIDAEDAALEGDDVDAAADANVRWWVDGPHRDGDRVDPRVRELVRRMQRLAFELTADWDDVDERELDPPALDRLAEVRAPTLVLTGALDLDAIHAAADRVHTGVSGARRVDWPDVAHLPSMERPGDFLALVRSWDAGHSGR